MTALPLLTNDIPRRARHCSKCQEPFQPGLIYQSVLLTDEKGRLQRQDFCETCWASAGLQEVTQSAVWQGRIPVKKRENVKEKLDEGVLEVLRDSLKSPLETDQHLAYVLAIHLVRRRILALRQTMQSQAGNMRLYEILATGEVFAIPNFELSQIASSDLQAKIDGLLQHLKK